jgi:hypothetical protein
MKGSSGVDTGLLETRAAAAAGAAGGTLEDGSEEGEEEWEEEEEEEWEEVGGGLTGDVYGGDSEEALEREFTKEEVSVCSGTIQAQLTELYWALVVLEVCSLTHKLWYETVSQGCINVILSQRYPHPHLGCGRGGNCCCRITSCCFHIVNSYYILLLYIIYYYI